MEDDRMTSDVRLGGSESDPAACPKPTSPAPPGDVSAVVPANRAEPSGNSLAIGFAWILAAVVVLFALRWAIPYCAEQIQYSLTRGRQRAEAETAAVGLGTLALDQLSKQYQMVSQRVSPSVVHIRIVSQHTIGPSDELSWKYRWETGGQGSGVIVDPEGYILTNYHVVRGADEIRISLSDGRKVNATLVGRDAATDLALLKISAQGLLAAEWGDSNDLEMGALVWAVGSPFGLQRSITFGILSAKNRAGVAGTVYQDFLQTDAAVNPGNSGGPLVDARGRVVGINTAIVGEAYQGISFAIPSSVARGIYERLKTSGSVERGWLGVSLEDVSDEMAQRLRLPAATGAHVIGVYHQTSRPSPAQQAGLKLDDVIVRWDGHATPDSATLSQLVARTEVGTLVSVTAIRLGVEREFQVQVGRRPDSID